MLGVHAPVFESLALLPTSSRRYPSETPPAARRDPLVEAIRIRRGVRASRSPFEQKIFPNYSEVTDMATITVGGLTFEYDPGETYFYPAEQGKPEPSPEEQARSRADGRAQAIKKFQALAAGQTLEAIEQTVQILFAQWMASCRSVQRSELDQLDVLEVVR